MDSANSPNKTRSVCDPFSRSSSRLHRRLLQCPLSLFQVDDKKASQAVPPGMAEVSEEDLQAVEEVSARDGVENPVDFQNKTPRTVKMFSLSQMRIKTLMTSMAAMVNEEVSATHLIIAHLIITHLIITHLIIAHLVIM